MNAAPSLVCWSPAESAAPAVSLVCFGWAGAGAGVFRSWPTHVPAGVAVWAVRLPGRESRLAEPPASDLGALATELARAIDGVVPRPWVLQGHCSGATLAFNVAHRLTQTAAPPAGVIVVAQDPPLGRPPAPPAGTARELLVGLGMSDPRIVDDPEMLELVEPAVRADMELLAGGGGVTDRLDAPITAVRGDADAIVTESAVRSWSRLTPTFSFRSAPGDHLFQGASADGLARLAGEIALEQAAPAGAATSP